MLSSKAIDDNAVVRAFQDDCTTFKQTPTSKLQYGDWLRYIPPRKQELNTHPKGSIRYFDGTRSAYPKQPSNGQKLNINRPIKRGSTTNIVTNVDPTKATTTPVEGNTNVKLVTAPTKQIVATIAPHGASHAKDSKLAAATSPLTPTMTITNTIAQSMKPKIADANYNLVPTVANTQHVSSKCQMEVTDPKSTNASTTPIVDNITGKMVVATDSKQAVATSSHPLREAIVSNETYPMEPNLAAATIHFELKIANVHTPSVTTIKQTEGANGVLSKDPTNHVPTNTNVPMILALKPQATSPFGPTMVPTTNPFGESDGFLEFLANPTETNNEATYLYDNMGLEATTMTTLSIPIEGEFKNPTAPV
ncbi:hypothetical protein V6N13_007790 [Hibiscus sabdariffa]